MQKIITRRRKQKKITEAGKKRSMYIGSFFLDNTVLSTKTLILA